MIMFGICILVSCWKVHDISPSIIYQSWVLAQGWIRALGPERLRSSWVKTKLLWFWSHLVALAIGEVFEEYLSPESHQTSHRHLAGRGTSSLSGFVGYDGVLLFVSLIQRLCVWEKSFGVSERYFGSMTFGVCVVSNQSGSKHNQSNFELDWVSSEYSLHDISLDYNEICVEFTNSHQALVGRGGLYEVSFPLS